MTNITEHAEPTPIATGHSSCAKIVSVIPVITGVSFAYVAHSLPLFSPELTPTQRAEPMPITTGFFLILLHPQVLSLGLQGLSGSLTWISRTIFNGSIMVHRLCWRGLLIPENCF